MSIVPGKYSQSCWLKEREALALPVRPPLPTLIVVLSWVHTVLGKTLAITLAVSISSTRKLSKLLQLAMSCSATSLELTRARKSATD